MRIPVTMRHIVACVAFALLIIARVGGQVDNCRNVQSQTQCMQTISDINALYCQFNPNGNVCFMGSNCKVCEKAQSGFCVPSCEGAPGSGCAESACPDAGCNRFLSGWSGNSCMRYTSGGFCFADGGLGAAAAVSATVRLFFLPPSTTVLRLLLLALTIILAFFAPTAIAMTYCASTGNLPNCNATSNVDDAAAGRCILRRTDVFSPNGPSYCYSSGFSQVVCNSGREVFCFYGDYNGIAIDICEIRCGSPIITVTGTLPATIAQAPPESAPSCKSAGIVPNCNTTYPSGDASAIAGLCLYNLAIPLSSYLQQDQFGYLKRHYCSSDRSKFLICLQIVANQTRYDIAEIQCQLAVVTLTGNDVAAVLLSLGSTTTTIATALTTDEVTSVTLTNMTSTAAPKITTASISAPQRTTTATTEVSEATTKVSEGPAAARTPSNGVDENTTVSDSGSTDIALAAGIAGGVGGALLLAIVAAVIAVLVYRKKLAKSNLRNSQLQDSIRNMSIRSMPMQDRDVSTRSSNSPCDHVPMVEREALDANPNAVHGNYGNPHVFATSDTVFTQLHASEVASSKDSIVVPPD